MNYHLSPIVAEHRTGLLDAVVGDADAAEPPGIAEWRDFGAAPAAGDRAPDGSVVKVGAQGPVRLYELLRSPRHLLLVFDGRAGTVAGYRNLADIGARVRDRFRGLVDVHMVIPRAAPPVALQWDGSVLLDADGGLHHLYGAGSECLYLVRPDGYVGYRSQPADGGRLMAYLKTVFV
jgi:hypothetical protein